MLIAQAVANSKEQFAGSPDLLKELINANIESLDAFTEFEHSGSELPRDPTPRAGSATGAW